MILHVHASMATSLDLKELAFKVPEQESIGSNVGEEIKIMPFLTLMHLNN